MSRIRALGIAAGAVLALAAARPLAAQEVGPANGSLVVVGGNLHDPEIIQRFIDLAGGPDAPIVLIPTAGGGDDADYDQFCSCARFLKDAGATDVTVLHSYDPEVANTEAFVEPLTRARGVWFGGGRQWRLVDAYAGTRTERAIRAVLDRGGVIGGSSAGASIQGSYLARGDTETNTVIMGDHEVGFGYLRGTAIDQHLLVRNRHFDMVSLVEAHPDLLGIGLDENTAIVVQGDRAQVMGQGYVAIYDHGAQMENGGRFYFLMPGDRFDLASREASRPGTTFRPLGVVEKKPWDGAAPAGVEAADPVGSSPSPIRSPQEHPLGPATPGPVIEPWGAVYDVEGLELPAPTDMDYRVLFEIANTPEADAGVNPELNTVARFLNMHARAGVALDRMHVAVVMHGPAGRNLLADAPYRARYQHDNPNSGLVQALLGAGVEFYLCGQTAMSRGLPGDELIPGVTLALSAMTARAVLQARGYRTVN